MITKNINKGTYQNESVRSFIMYAYDLCHALKEKSSVGVQCAASLHNIALHIECARFIGPTQGAAKAESFARQLAKIIPPEFAPGFNERVASDLGIDLNPPDTALEPLKPVDLFKLYRLCVLEAA